MRLISAYTLTLLLTIAPVVSYAAADPKASPEQAVVVTAPSAGETGEAVADEMLAQEHEAEEHAEAGLPQLNIDTYPSQVFWLLVMFTVLYVAFSKSILPSIGSVVEGRDSLIKGNLDEAQELKDQAQAIQDSYEKNLDAARARAVSAIQEVEAAAKKKANDQIDIFRKRAENEMTQAEVRVVAARERAMGDMANVAAEVASVAAEKITGIGTDVQNARAIVDSIAGKAKAA